MSGMSIPENDCLDQFNMTQSVNCPPSRNSTASANIIGGRSLTNEKLTSSNSNINSFIDPNSLPSLENHPYGLDSFTAPNHNSSNSNQVQPNSDILVQNQGNIDKKRRRRRSHAVIQSAQREF